MGSFNQMCMVSNIPIKPDTQIKIFFLIPNGDYRNDKTIMTGAMPNPWSAFKVLGGICVDAIYRGYNRFEVVKNEKSDYLLDLIKKVSSEPILDFSKVFELINEGKLLCKSFSRENVYMNFSCVYNFAYHKLVSDAENQKKHFKDILSNELSKIDKIISERQDEVSTSPEKVKQLKQIMIENIKFFEEYTPTCLDNNLGKCSFFLFSQYRPELKPDQVFEKIIDDILFMNNIYELGLTLSPKTLNHEIACSKLRTEILTQSLECFLNSHEDEDYVRVNNRVKIIQEVTITSLTDYLEEYDKDMQKEKVELEAFINEHKGKREVYINAVNIESLSFLKVALLDKKNDLLILL